MNKYEICRSNPYNCYPISFFHLLCDRNLPAQLWKWPAKHLSFTDTGFCILVSVVYFSHILYAIQTTISLMFILKHKDNILTTENFKNQLEQINIKKNYQGWYNKVHTSSRTSIESESLIEDVWRAPFAMHVEMEAGVETTISGEPDNAVLCKMSNRRSISPRHWKLNQSLESRHKDTFLKWE